ncbi:MAG: hypothetical protein V5A38_03015 [Halolamina sp.]|uniref:hypothetical protein n=1 Tax=Halolamina sp. TaxID=1940283 RepID=UPI002FC2EDA6
MADDTDGDAGTPEVTPGEGRTPEAEQAVVSDAVGAGFDREVASVPGPATALVLAVTAGAQCALVRVRSVATVLHSPNSGWPMATVAAVCDYRLDAPGTSGLFPERPLPDAGTATAGIDVMRRDGVVRSPLIRVTTGLFGELSAARGEGCF